MARARSIKPAFFDNEILGELSPLTRLLFIGLWGRADREGRLQDRPKRLKKEILGYDDITSQDVDGMLQSLHDNDFIIRYELDGVRYIQVTNFSKHQYPSHKEAASEIPPPPGWTPPQKSKKVEDEDGPMPDSGQYGADPAPAQPGTGHLVPPSDDLVPGTGSPPSGKAEKGSQEERFQTFWAAYPKKVAQKAARTQWMALKPSKALFGRIMAAVEAAKKSQQWTKDNGQYIPNPANWLKGGCWDDKLTEVKPHGTKTGGTAGTGSVGGFQPAEPDSG